MSITTNGKYVIAKYLRISAEDIDLDGFDKYESNSIGNQRALIDDFISKIPEFQGDNANIEIIEAMDDGKSGTNFSRDGVQRLIEMAQRGEVHCIICKDLSRWGRSYIEVGDFLEQKFPLWGVRFISITDGYDSASLSGGTAGIDIAFRNLIYEMYSQDLSEKVKSARTSMAKNGKNSNAECFYGYIKNPSDKRSLLVDEPVREIVERIFDLALEGHSATNIAKLLNTDNVTTPQIRKMETGSRRRWRGGDKSFWYGSVISTILKDERYTGKWVYGKSTRKVVGDPKQTRVPREEWIVVPNAIPAIISEEKFAMVQKVIAPRSKPPTKKPQSNLIFTRKLVCGFCGKGLKATHRKDEVKYSCGTKSLTQRYGCEDFTVLERDIANAVLRALQHQIAIVSEFKQMQESITKSQVSGIDKVRNEIARLQKLVDKAQTDKMALWEKYHQGKISAEAFQTENEKADEKATQTSKKLAQLQGEVEILSNTTTQEDALVKKYENHIGVTTLTREVVKQFIYEVRVYSADRIEIIFNFADEYAKLQARLNGYKKIASA
jgi:DNA invertase Pin-like site-specific DNA recombinase